MLNRANGDPRFLHFDRLIILTFTAACVVAWILVVQNPTLPLALGAAGATLAVGRWMYVRERETLEDTLRLARTMAGRLVKA